MTKHFITSLTKKSVLLLIPFIFMCLHPYFVAVTEIKHNPKTKTLEITCKMFTNDLQKALIKDAGEKVDILHPQDKKKMDTLLFAYVKKKLGISVNGKQTPYNFVGYENEDESALIYLETVVVEQPVKIEATVKFLTEIIDQQTNIVHAEVGATKHSYKLSMPEHEVKFEFK